MAEKIGKRTTIFENKPSIISYGSAVGKKRAFNKRGLL